jgi:hypothetical protein
MLVEHIKGERLRLLEKVSAYVGIKGQGVNTAEYVLADDGALTVRPGFEWDGSTFVRDTKYCTRASLFHDVLCIMIKNGQLPKQQRKRADLLSRRWCIEDGMPRHEANFRYFGLSLYRLIS